MFLTDRCDERGHTEGNTREKEKGNPISSHTPYPHTSFFDTTIDMNNASVSYPKCTPGDLPHIKPTGPASNCINEMDVGPIRPSMDGGQTGRCSDTRSTPPIRPHCVSSYCFAWRNNRSTPPPVRAVWIEPLHMHTREWLVYADRHTHTHTCICMYVGRFDSDLGCTHKWEKNLTYATMRCTYPKPQMWRVTPIVCVSRYGLSRVKGVHV